jgi:hypothetical protein
LAARPAISPAIPGITWWSQRDQQAIRPVTKVASATERAELPVVNSKTAMPSAGELLAENPLQSRSLSSETKPIEPEVKPSEVTKTEPMIPTLPEPQPPTTIAAIDLVSTGAWWIDEASCSVRYRPQGHGDEWLKLLLDLAAKATGKTESPTDLLRVALAESSTKSCASCHSIDREDTRFQVRWHAEYRDVTKHAFTEFSHRPHTMQPQLRDCSHCHQLNPNGNNMVNYETTEPRRVAHDFLPLTKASCVECHASNTSESRCVLCHSYHVGLKKSTGK